MNDEQTTQLTAGLALELMRCREERKGDLDLAGIAIEIGKALQGERDAAVAEVRHLKLELDAAKAHIELLEEETDADRYRRQGLGTVNNNFRPPPG